MRAFRTAMIRCLRMFFFILMALEASPFIVGAISYLETPNPRYCVFHGGWGLIIPGLGIPCNKWARAPRWIDMHVYAPNDTPVAAYSLGDEGLNGVFLAPTALVRLPVGLPFNISGVGDLPAFCKIDCDVLGLYNQAVGTNDMATTPNSTVTWDTWSGYPGVWYHGSPGPE